MGKTLLTMQTSTAKGTGREGDDKEGEKQTRSMCRNVVQVFGFKNNFRREAGHNGISRKLPVPNKRARKAPM